MDKSSLDLQTCVGDRVAPTHQTNSLSGGTKIVGSNGREPKSSQKERLLATRINRVMVTHSRAEITARSADDSDQQTCFPPVLHVVDVAGGQGGLLVALLERCSSPSTTDASTNSGETSKNTHNKALGDIENQRRKETRKNDLLRGLCSHGSLFEVPEIIEGLTTLYSDDKAQADECCFRKRLVLTKHPTTSRNEDASKKNSDKKKNQKRDDCVLRLVPGNFFAEDEEGISIGTRNRTRASGLPWADVYLLKDVLHAASDEDAVWILTLLRDTMKDKRNYYEQLHLASSSTSSSSSSEAVSCLPPPPLLILIETPLPDRSGPILPDTPSTGARRSGPDAVLFVAEHTSSLLPASLEMEDVNMMTLGQGSKRTINSWGQLLARAGFQWWLESPSQMDGAGGSEVLLLATLPS